MIQVFDAHFQPRRFSSRRESASSTTSERFFSGSFKAYQLGDVVQLFDHVADDQINQPVRTLFETVGSDRFLRYHQAANLFYR